MSKEVPRGLSLSGGWDKGEKENGMILPSKGDARSPVTGIRLSPLAEEEVVSLAEPLPEFEIKRTALGRLIDMVAKPTRRVIGIMSGTSLDAIDLAYLEVQGRYPNAKVGLLRFAAYEFPADIRKEVLELITPFVPPKTAEAKKEILAKLEKMVEDETLDLGHSDSIKRICRLDFLLGEAFAGVINEFFDENEIDPAEVDLIATAGQTIWHDPEMVELFTDWPPFHIETRSTFALGQSAVIAERTGVTTVGDLRVRDVAAGGHGAPLIPYADLVLLQDKELGRCIQNIGGIGNVTYLPPKPAGIGQVIAFDTGPGNMIIDALASIASDFTMKCDQDGAYASKGTVKIDILARLLRHKFILEKPPKSTGRETFGVQFAKRLVNNNPNVPMEDLIATATEFTAQSIARSYRRHIASKGHRIHQVILGGGGKNNPELVRRLKEALALFVGPVEVANHEAVGLLSQAKEPMAMAIIGDDAVAGLETNVPGATGARSAVLGKISLGSGQRNK